MLLTTIKDYYRLLQTITDYYWLNLQTNQSPNQKSSPKQAYRYCKSNLFFYQSTFL